ncbi:MAG: HDOD domain-containing protein [Deltaproteobacteria bacterium]|nr:HDOD domain-containing protein [Deltaproteobacteria bacterium]
MVLAKDIPGLDGGVFMAKGTCLDPGSIEALDDLGAPFVFVTPGHDDTSLAVSRTEDYVARFFAYVNPDNPAILELYRLVLERAYKSVFPKWLLPCEKDLRAKNVEHMKDLFFKDHGDIDELVRHETELASFPDVYFKIKEILDSPTSSAADIAKVVASDVGLSAKLLRLVNSSLFSFSSKIDSVTHAVSLIGTRELATLALGISTINFFKDIPPELIDMKVFWRHSLSCGVFGKLIAGQIPEFKADKFFTAGLLHDCGRLIMYKNMPYASVQALLSARTEMLPLVDAEQQILGFNHTEVARKLMETWSFPSNLTTIIGGHHDPMASDEPRETAVITLADILANAAAISSGGTFVLPALPDDAWEILGLKPEKLKAILQDHDRSIAEVTAVFL